MRISVTKVLRTFVLTIFASAALAAPALAANPFLALTPTYQETPWTGPATWTLQWSGFPTFIQDFTMHFGDGGSNTYRCWSNCSDGYTSWNHRFGSIGDFTQYVSNGTIFSNGATTHVY